MGIPTMLLTRQGFTQVVGNAFAGLGFAAEGPTVYEFPLEMFLAASDLTPIKENFDKIVYGLTKWQPKIKSKGVFRPEMVTVQGRDYQNALENMNALFLRNTWGDGLPLWPATEERVTWILTGTDLGRDMVIGKIGPRGGIATVETVATLLAMAGGRPEYLPVCIAATQAIASAKMGIERLNATTNSVYLAVVVNGPIAKSMRLSYGYGLLGPDPQHPANGPIGRVIRLLLQDPGGGIPGIGTMAIFGGMRHANAVFAEDEEGLPKGWKSLGEERGYPKGANIVTVIPVASENNILLTAADVTKADDTARAFLYDITTYMRSSNGNLFSDVRRTPPDPDWDTGIVLIGRGFADTLASTGWSKESVKQFLWENSKVPWADLVKAGMSKRAQESTGISGQDVPLVATPQQMKVIVTGGVQSGHAYWMQIGSAQYRMVSQEIKVPARWNDLIKAAESDLGVAPSW
jgi:hypothetical protein